VKGLGESHLVCALTSKIRRSFLTVFTIELLFARTSMRNTGMLCSSIFFFMACSVLATAHYWYLGLRSRWRVQGRWKVTDVRWKVTDVRDLHFMGAYVRKSIVNPLPTPCFAQCRPASCLGTRWIRCRFCGELTTRCVAVELGEGGFALRANSPSAKTSCRADNIWPDIHIRC